MELMEMIQGSLRLGPNKREEVTSLDREPYPRLIRPELAELFN